jgi:hypothetical protein
MQQWGSNATVGTCVQLVSGLHPVALWSAVLLTDCSFFCVPALIILLLLHLSGLPALGIAMAPLLASLLALYGLASISQV